MNVNKYTASTLRVRVKLARSDARTKILLGIDDSYIDFDLNNDTFTSLLEFFSDDSVSESTREFIIDRSGIYG